MFDLTSVVGGPPATASQSLNDVDGNRVVYTDDRNGAPDVYVYEFQLIGTLAVSPESYSYGDVQIGTPKQTIVTISNPAPAGDVSITDLAFASGSSAAFTIASPPSLPYTLSPGSTLDVTVAFAPTTSGLAGAVLFVSSTDPNHASTPVELSGTGVAVDTPSSVLTELLWLEAQVMAGTLTGSGAGKSAPGRLGALRNQLDATGDLIDAGLISDACVQLKDAANRCDGIEPPPDFVTGAPASTTELMTRIAALQAQIGCP